VAVLQFHVGALRLVGDAHRPGKSFLFTMDNLHIHKHPVILNLIHRRNHCVIFWAPYWSCDGAIEYIFNTIQTKLQMDVYGFDTVFNLVLTKFIQLLGKCCPSSVILFM